MTRYRVKVTATAERHIGVIESWWTANRGTAALPFAEELERAFERLSTFPFSGVPYPVPTPPGIRRLLLRKCGYHVYYTVNEEEGVVMVRAVWHSARGQPPPL